MIVHQRSAPARRTGLVILCFLALGLLSSSAQNLRYDNRRRVAIPEYATIRLGPFYSNWRLGASVGYRWVRTSGTGTDFIIGGSRGGINKDGSDFPVIIGLATRNYLIISESADLDVSVAFRYEYYPLDTQDSRFRIYLPDEGIAANLSLGWSPEPLLRTEFYDRFLWKTDYIDSRGLEDRYGGREYEYIANTIGVEGDLLVARGHNVGFGLSRTDRWSLDRDFDAQAYTRHRAELLYEYQPREYLVVGAGADIAHTDYPQTNRAAVLIHQYRALGRLKATERTDLDAFIGYAFAEYGSEADDERGSAPSSIYGASLQTRMSPTLSHRLAYTRGLREGFDTAVDIYDSLAYEIHWTRDLLKTRGFAHWSRYNPSSEERNGYTDSRIGADVTIPVLPYLHVQTSTYYAIRANENRTVVEGDPEQSSDYRTWGVRAGTILRLTKLFRFSIFADHVERTGDDEILDYTRDVVSAVLTYSKDL